MPQRESDGPEPAAATGDAAEQTERLPIAAVITILVVAILAISSSAVLILWADAPAVSVTFWRTLGGAIVLAPAALRSAHRPSRGQWAVIIASGIALGAHFSTWLTSLELTSVAASVTLVSTVPIFIAVLLLLLGRPPSSATWLAIALAIVGTAIITIGDAAGSADAGANGTGSGAHTPEDPLLGDLLALAGAATMAVYLMLGDRLRSSLSTAAYASRTYAVAAGSVLVFGLAIGTEFTGYSTTTWLAIGGMVLGPQLAGHTALNYLLRRLGSVSVSLALLLEPIGAATLVWLIFDQVPPLAAVLGGPIVLIAVALQIMIRSGQTETVDGAAVSSV